MIGFDACLMATYETASTLQDVADRMLASQELEPGYGWNYTALETAARGGSVDDLAGAIITAYDEQSTSEGEAQVTLSETDLTKMPAVDTAVDAFAAALTGNISEAGPTVGRSLAQTLGFGATPDYNFFMTDLGLLAGQIGDDASSVSAEADAVTEAIGAAVINKVDGQATRGAVRHGDLLPAAAGRLQRRLRRRGRGGQLDRVPEDLLRRRSGQRRRRRSSHPLRRFRSSPTAAS